MNPYPEPAVIAVAFSGGRDSAALLHATAVAAQGTALRVVALHVHHGLSAHADEWALLGRRQCERWARRGLPVTFVMQRLAGRPSAGESVEAWARAGRYRALREMALAAGASVVLLAHHRRDQAETLLLQALRGAGMAGLAAMPATITRDGIQWMRPWLGRPREAIEAYVRRHRIAYVEDDSNADPRFARNRLRLSVWPSLVDAFPDAETSLASAAAWAQQGRAALAELAAIDIETVSDAAGIHLERFHALSEARRSNVLREWIALACGQGQAAPAALVQRLLVELPGGKGPARWACAGGELRRYRGRLGFVGSAESSAGPGSPGHAAHLHVRRAGVHEVDGWPGRLRVTRVREGGVAMAWLAAIELRARAGGEQFQPAPDRPARSLKKQFQAAGIPEWQRTGPLIYCNGQLVFVPGLGIDARAKAERGVAQALLEWLPASASKGDVGPDAGAMKEGPP